MHLDICNGIPADWDIATIEDICDRVTSGGTPSRARPEFYQDGGWGWVKTQELQDAWIDQTEERITDDAIENSSAKVLPANTVLLALYGATVGQLGILRRPMTCNQACCAMIVDQNKADFRYVYYQLRLARTQLRSLATGAAQQNLSGALMKSLGLPLPPLPEQKRIAHILGTLDDKIELNRRMNATLEAMSRAIFKSWFVDFDPVRQKAAGKQPVGMDSQTAALFPDSLQESLHGPIPDGWVVDSIKNRASNIQYGFTQSATSEPVGPHFLRITDISGGQIDWTSVPFCQATVAEQEKYRIVDGDIVIARTGASTGDNTYIVEPPLAVFASYLVRIQFSSRGVGRLVGEFARTSDYASYVTGMIGGSAQPNASAQTLAAAPMVFPTEEVANAFYVFVRPLDISRAANDRESRTLAALRDTLLPKLLSGELRVPEAEGMVEEAVG